MKQKKKWKIAAVIVALLVLASAAAFFVIRYFNYGAYKQYIKGYEAHEGGQFSPISETAPSVAGMVLAAENDSLKLYTNTKTSEIAVYEKATGHITYSNPVDREEDTVATGVNKSLLSATFEIVYYNSSSIRGTMNNYDMSIKYEQFEAQKIKDGIKYIYTLENPENSTGIVPDKISEERLQTLVLDKLDEKDQRTVRGRFTLKDGIYTLNEATKSAKIQMSQLNKLFEQSGYTREDYAADMEGTEGAEILSFTIPVEYRLTENGLEAAVCTNEISESGGAKITRIRLLPMFGAAGTQAEGYMVVPDGSGALINLNNGKSSQTYMQNVYGIDPVAQSYVVTEITENARIPIFGMKDGEYAFLGRITGGDALGVINASVSGGMNAYNNIYAEFCVREMELLNMFGVSGSSADVPAVENNLYNERLSVLYSFLSGDEADYSGMAKCYREQLVEEGALLQASKSGDIPFYLDILGGVEIQKHFMGVPYDGVYAMTTYEQAGELLDSLYKSGIGNVRMNYLGWFNGGVYHDAADKIKLIKKLGSKTELEELSRRLEENGGGLFVDTAFQNVSYTSKRFNNLLEASKYYSGYVVQLGALNPATMRQTSFLNWYDELGYYVVSPKFLPWYTGHFADKIQKLDVSGIALRDLGDVLASDKKRTELIDRQAALSIVKAQYDKLKDTGKSLMESGGNAYTFGYVSDITNAPVNYSKFYIIDEQIPFYEMVIHGSIDYTGESLNLMDKDVDRELLLTWIEYGSAPKFTLSYEDSQNIKYTSSSDMYSVCYTTWLEDAYEIYDTLNDALSQVQGAKMLHHEMLENNVAKVVYDNGVTIYINKTDDAVTVNGVAVDAMSYKVLGGAA